MQDSNFVIFVAKVEFNISAIRNGKKTSNIREKNCENCEEKKSTQKVRT